MTRSSEFQCSEEMNELFMNEMRGSFKRNILVIAVKLLKLYRFSPFRRMLIGVVHCSPRLSALKRQFVA